MLKISNNLNKGKTTFNFRRFRKDKRNQVWYEKDRQEQCGTQRDSPRKMIYF